MAGRGKQIEGVRQKDTGPQLVTDGEKPLRPSECRAYMRRRLAGEFRGIVDGFVKSAKAGSCQHVKLATELLEPKRNVAKKPGSGRRTMERWLEEVERSL